MVNVITNFPSTEFLIYIKECLNIRLLCFLNSDFSTYQSLLQYTITFTTFFLLWRCDPTRVMASLFLRFLDHTQRRTRVGRTPLYEWSARRTDLYLTTHNYSQQTKVHAPSGIQTHNLSRRAASDLRLRPGGHWDRPHIYHYYFKINVAPKF